MFLGGTQKAGEEVPLIYVTTRNWTQVGPAPDGSSEWTDDVALAPHGAGARHSAWVQAAWQHPPQGPASGPIETRRMMINHRVFSSYSLEHRLRPGSQQFQGNHIEREAGTSLSLELGTALSFRLTCPLGAGLASSSLSLPNSYCPRWDSPTSLLSELFFLFEKAFCPAGQISTSLLA